MDAAEPDSIGAGVRGRTFTLRPLAWQARSGASGVAPVSTRLAGSNYVYTTDKAALDLTGSLAIAVLVAMDDWTPTATQNIAGKYETTAATRSFLFSVLSSGVFRFAAAVGGTSSGVDVNSGAGTAPGFTNGSVQWIGVDRDGSTGTVRFWRAAATADRSLPSSWTQVGTDKAASATAINNSTAELRIGVSAGSNFLVGDVHRFVLFSGNLTAGSVVADFLGGSLGGDAYGNTWALS